jgi:hypothetical protein
LSENIGALLFFGCVTGGLLGVVYAFIHGTIKDNKKRKKGLERLEKIQSSINLIFELVKKNDYKSFSVDICELKDKSVNFIQKYGDRTEFPIQIKEAKFTCLVQPQENKFLTLINMKGVDLRDNTNRNISFWYKISSNDVEINLDGKGFHSREVENNKLLNYIIDDLKFPIGNYKYRPSTKIETDF